jgi:5-hydroxyisourate hydrolase-like protein (transthyretin family)
MNDKRFLKVLLLILLISVFAMTNAARASQSSQEQKIRLNNIWAGGAISGTVTDGAVPLQMIEVRVFPWTGSGYVWLKSTYTDAFGSYEVSDLSTGVYRIGFHDGDYVYADEYYDDMPFLGSATDISVTADLTTSSIDAVLAEGGRITGTIIDGTDPIADITVQVYLHNGSSWEQFSEDLTDASGNYDIGHLPAGTYRACLPARTG